MKDFIIKRKKLFISLCLAFALVLGAGIGVYSFAQKGSDVTVTLDKKSVTLEKGETFTFEPKVSGTDDKIVWKITDETVATVENGKVTALKEGSAVVTATAGGKEARCQIKVTDNGLVLKLETNVGNEDLNIMVGDSFDLVYSATYNSKAVNAVISVSVLDESVATINSGRINTAAAGSTQIVISAEWNGMKALDVINLNVVYDFIVGYESDTEFTVYNDSRAGETTYTIVPVLTENGKVLSKAQYEVSAAAYDEKIIGFDKTSLTVSGLTKGSTELELTFKSKVTGNAVKSTVNVTVGLYTEDKSASIKIPNAYIDEGNYAVSVKDVFADLSAEEIKGLSILALDDVTGASPIAISLENGVADTSGFIASGITGDRLWRVQSEKYSYIVKITVSEYNGLTYLLGEYLSPDAAYKYVLSEENNSNVVKVYNADTNALVTDGTFTIYPNDKKNGKIKINLKDNIGGANEHYGVYMYLEPMRLSFTLGGKYCDFYSLAEGPYEDMADTYSCNDWIVKIKLGADKTLEFDVENKVGLYQKGTYSLTPSSLDGGTITLSFDKPVLGSTSFECKYKNDGKKYSFGIKVGNKTYYFVQEGEISSANGVTEAFGGGYSSRGKNSDGTSGIWCSMYFAKDGTMFFDTYILSNISTVGTYVLNGDKQSGTITVDIEKAYCGNTRFEGTYRYDTASGKYVFEMFVYGSGYDTLTFTQQK